MNNQGKNVIVTGGAGAVGRAIAKRFAKEGARIAIVDVDFEGAVAVADDIKKDGGEAVAIQADAAEENQVIQMAEEGLKVFGGIDVLINSAGEFKEMPMMEITVDYWDRMMRNNLRNTFICTKIIGEIMGKHEGGRIINISSTAAERGRSGQIAYCAAKGGIETFTMSAAIQLGPLGVNVNAIAPGILETDNREVLFDDEKLEEYTKKRMPITRWGRPEEVAGTAIFLAGPDASYITGHTIVVDGGLMTRLCTCGEDR